MVPVYDINNEQDKNIMSVEEDFLNDIKAKEIKPARLSETVSAFSNAAGGGPEPADPGREPPTGL
ncbi:MAG TPA: hypothetical protein VII97_00355 [Anaerolineales bacterium]